LPTVAEIVAGCRCFCSSAREALLFGRGEKIALRASLGRGEVVRKAASTWEMATTPVLDFNHAVGSTFRLQPGAS